MSSVFSYLIFLPVFLGLISFSVKKLSRYLFVVYCLLVLALLFLNSENFISSVFSNKWFLDYEFLFKFNSFSYFFIVFSTILTFLIGFFELKNVGFYEKNYYSLLLINLGIVNGIFLSGNLVVLIFLWELAAINLYLFLFLTDKDSYKIATKTLYIVGGSDFCLLLGLIILSFRSDYATVSYTLIAIGALAKAGCLPFHTWIPDAAEIAPCSIMAYLPGSIDKLLGIYLLVRLSVDFFSPSTNLVLMALGASTIIIAVFMALYQHNLKKLLSYHAVSQVGYMVLGVATGSPLGIAGGMLHMLNHSIYKSCLFLCAGAVENKTGNTDIDKLGGLANFKGGMPITFVATTVSALAISGVPPFNGFFSKWMIYQSLIENINITKSFWVILFTLTAFFGSALTLASFIKVLYSVFLKKPQENISCGEVSWNMIFSMIILSLLSLAFGIFAYEVPLKLYIFPSLSGSFKLTNFGNFFIGIWDPKFTTILILSGLLLGFILFILSILRNARQVPVYLLGEDLNNFKQPVKGGEFYLSVSETEPFKTLYSFAEYKYFDFYEWWLLIINFFSNVSYLFIYKLLDIYYYSKKIVFYIGQKLSGLHNGNLHYYLTWFVVGAVVLILLIK